MNPLTSEPSATVPVSMEFYPVARIESRLVAGGLTPRLWRFEVSASVPDRGVLQAYWPTVASVMLMLVGFGLIVRANRRADELARMQADFIAYASHQLKTPLSLVSAAIETVEMAYADHRIPGDSLIGDAGRGLPQILSVLEQRVASPRAARAPQERRVSRRDLGVDVARPLSLRARRRSASIPIASHAKRATAPRPSCYSVRAAALDSATSAMNIAAAGNRNAAVGETTA